MKLGNFLSLAKLNQVRSFLHQLLAFHLHCLMQFLLQAYNDCITYKESYSELSLTNHMNLSLDTFVCFTSLNVVSLEILSSIKDITKLKDMKINNLTNIKGVGRVKAITLLASI